MTIKSEPFTKRDWRKRMTKYMDDFRKWAHLVEKLGEERVRVLIDSGNTGEVMRLCDSILKPKVPAPMIAAPPREKDIVRAAIERSDMRVKDLLELYNPGPGKFGHVFLNSQTIRTLKRSDWCRTSSDYVIPARSSAQIFRADIPGFRRIIPLSVLSPTTPCAVLVEENVRGCRYVHHMGVRRTDIPPHLQVALFSTLVLDEQKDEKTCTRCNGRGMLGTFDITVQDYPRNCDGCNGTKKIVKTFMVVSDLVPGPVGISVKIGPPEEAAGAVATVADALKLGFQSAEVIP
jgi:hypothetical protein